MRPCDFDVLPFNGRYLIHRSTASRSRHETFGAAEAEALRLASRDPDGTFIITQEVARVQRARSAAAPIGAAGIPLTRRMK
ncbi:MAG: hypothetical protein ACRYHC_01730 [Janthinobacterium lividum]